MSYHYDTEIVYGLNNIIDRTLARLSQANNRIDACISGAAVAGIVKAKPVFDITVSLKRKGVKIRYVTDITSQNLPYVKELMKTAEFRHLDGIKGNYSIVDGLDYQATAAVDEGEGPTESVLSTAKAFVDQQQFVFDMLWKKAIPAKLRISELEEGLKREFIETIRGQSEIRPIISDVINSALEEINVVLPSNNLFYKAEKENILKLLKNKISNDKDLTVKILSDQELGINDTMKTISPHDKNFYYGLMNEIIQSQVIIITTDGEYVLAIESKDISTEENEIAENVLAIYSNSKYTVMTYESIFETLWTKAKMLYPKSIPERRSNTQV